jgi:hypothetical protein
VLQVSTVHDSPSLHTTPHERHEVVEDSDASQPSVATVLQSPHPAVHTYPHSPPLHVELAFARAGHEVSAGVSSVVPSQSSSSPLHVSVVAGLEPVAVTVIVCVGAVQVAPLTPPQFSLPMCGRAM